MEKAPIKKFAVEARRKLIADVTFRLERCGITEKGIVEPQTSTDKELVFDLGNGNTQIIKGERYVNRYRNLVAYMRGFYVGGNPKQQLEQFIEKIAFTWFNRLIAIRFMEVNRYIPVRVLSSEIEGQKLPDLVASPFSGDLEFTDAEKQEIFDLQDKNREDDLFRFLFFRQCNALSRILPRLFEDLDGSKSFSELLVALSFNDPNGVVYHLVNDVEEPWFDIHATGQVQIIGWMYQYYNTEPKDKVFADLKKNIKISKQNIPAATQLFTPDWIVRYMVENSLGRLWYEGHPGFDKSEWKYYLDEAPQEPQVEQQLKDIRAQYAKMEPEQLKVIDPCMGSGHILCYLFDVLMQIYLDNGYSKREAVRSILKNNLFGLDISERATQIAYFSVMMKAREYDSNFFSRSNIPQPRVYDIQESNWMGGAYKHEMGNFLNSQQHRDTLNYLLDAFVDAKEYGSILQIKPLDYEGLKEAWETSASATAGDINMVMWYDAAKDAVAQLIEQAVVLSQKYDAVVTNPPYMGSSGMGAKLSEFVKKNYPDSKSDLFAVCIERGNQMVKLHGFNCMVTMQSWMFLSSFEKMRVNILQTKNITNLMHMENMVLGIAFGTAVTVFQNGYIAGYKGTYNHVKYEDIEGDEPKMFPVRGNRFAQVSADNFAKIPGSPVAYWVSSNFLKAFDNEKIGKYAISDGQTKTGDNDKYLRLLWEVPVAEIGKGKHWVLHAKGGAFRRWYGNIDTLIDWSNSAREHYRADRVARIAPEYIWFRKGICWTLISSNKLHGFRLLEDNSTFNLAAPSVFFEDDRMMLYVLGYLNSKFSQEIIALLNPTLNTNISDITAQPLCYGKSQEQDDDVVNLVTRNIELSKVDWDAFETSWDFKKHPLV